MSVELILENKNANVFTVPVENTMILGRGEECDLRIASNSVSRKHCRLEVKGDTVAIRDLGSSNGTFINNRRLPEKKAVKLVHGMVIKIGPMVAKVNIPGAESVESSLAAPEPEATHPAEMDTAEFEGVIPPEEELEASEQNEPELETVPSETEQDDLPDESGDTAFFDQEELDEVIEEENELDVDEDEVTDEEEQTLEEDEEFVEDEDNDVESEETLTDEELEDVEEYEVEDDETTSGMDEFFPEDNFDEDDLFGETDDDPEYEVEEDRVDISSNDDESLSDFLKGLE